MESYPAAQRLCFDQGNTPRLSVLRQEGLSCRSYFLPTQVLSRSASPRTFFGVEVEVDLPGLDYYNFNNITAKQGELADVWQEFGLGYTKLDSTVTGVESVTFPHTFERLRDSRFEEALRAFKKIGAAAWGRPGPGLHIHVNKTAFTDREHIWRFCAVHEANVVTLKKLAGRRGPLFNPWPNGNGDPPAPTRCIDIDGLGFAQRQTAINITPPTTIELRFWQGTLQPVGALGAAAVESCIFEYTKKLEAAHVVTDALYKFAPMIEWAKTNLPDEHARILALKDLRSGNSEE